MMGALIPILAAFAAGLWLATCLASPRPPRRGDEAAMLVWAQRRGQRDRLLLLAVLTTALLGGCALVGILAQAATPGE